MKRLLQTGLAGFLVLASASAETAYDALKTVRESRGDPALHSLIEVRGEAGNPQPSSWTVVMNDPTARGGVRELVISEDQIVSERTPVRGFENKLPPLNFERLNLDSDGAFRIANEQAIARKIGFHTANYWLQMSEAGDSPVWVVQLFDYMGAPVGHVRISAESGRVVQGLQLDPDARYVSETAPSQPPVRRQRARTYDYAEERYEEEAAPGGLIGRVGRTARNVGERVAGTTETVVDRTRRTTLRIVGNIQQFLTGERTLDRSVRDEEEEE